MTTDTDRRGGDPRWPEDQEMALRKMWMDGVSIRQMAKHFPPGGPGKIAGKASRLKLPARQVSFRPDVMPSARVDHLTDTTPWNVKHKVVPVARKGSSKPIPPMPAAAADPADIATKSVDDVEANHCRWPCAEHVNNQTAIYCGAEKYPESAYCARHTLRGYTCGPDSAFRGLAMAAKNGDSH